MWLLGVPQPAARLTSIGVFHHGGEVPALAQVHGHKGCVFADDIACLAGVHGIHLIAAVGPWRGRGEAGVMVRTQELLQQLKAGPGQRSLLLAGSLLSKHRKESVKLKGMVMETHKTGSLGVGVGNRQEGLAGALEPVR